MKHLKCRLFKACFSFIVILSVIVASSTTAYADNSDYYSECESLGIPFSEALQMLNASRDNIDKNATSIGKTQLLTLTLKEPRGDLIPGGQTWQSSVTFSGSNWGSYRKFDGNRVAVAFQFHLVDPANSHPDIQTTFFYLNMVSKQLVGGMQLQLKRER